MDSRKIRFGAAALAAACMLGIVGLSAAGEEYVVRKGDTLRGLAKSHLGDEDRWGELARLNGLAAPYTIQAGQKLQMPGEGAGSASGVVRTGAPDSASRGTSGGASHPSAGVEWQATPAGKAALSMARASSSNELSSRGQVFFWGGIGIIVLAAGVHLVGLILFLVAAFNESFWWGIGTILIHPVWIVFLVKFCDKAKRGFLVQLGAWGVAACGAALILCTPLVN